MPKTDTDNVKPGNASRCYWQDGDHAPTPVAMLYLHGFTASPGEAAELPEIMADALNANLYVHRWPGHGTDEPTAMQGLTVETLQDSAAEALARACSMGDQVVIVGSSLGATLGLWLASQRPRDVAAVVAWSPGVQAAIPSLLEAACAEVEPITDPRPRTAAAQAFWSKTVHPDGYRALRTMFASFTVDPPWPQVRCPVFLGYYRAPAGDEDQTASVPAMLAMFDALGTPLENKHAIAFASGAHVIGSPHKSLVARQVADASIDFLRDQLMRLAHARAG